MKEENQPKRQKQKIQNSSRKGRMFQSIFQCSCLTTFHNPYVVSHAIYSIGFGKTGKESHKMMSVFIFGCGSTGEFQLSRALYYCTNTLQFTYIALAKRRTIVHTVCESDLLGGNRHNLKQYFTTGKFC